MAEGKGIATTTMLIGDEFHEHFADLHKNAHKAAVRDLLLSVATERVKLMPLVAITNKYLPLTAPHLNILAFSTPNEMFAALGGNSTANGLVNRFIILATKDRPKKKRAMLMEGKPIFSAFTADALAKLVGLQADVDEKGAAVLVGTKVPWGEHGFNHWAALDEAEIEPLKDELGVGAIAGRLSEDVIKMATLFAINEDSLNPQVFPHHIDDAWHLRKGIFDLFIKTLNGAGGLGASDTAIVESDVKEAMFNWSKKHGEKPMPQSDLKKNCSRFRNIKPYEREGVIKALVGDGFLVEHKSRRGVAFSR